MNTIQTLEFIKYFTLIDWSWGFEPNPSGIYDYVTEETEFVMPEKITVNGKEEYLKFIIRQWRINMDMHFMPSKQSPNFCDNYWCFDLTNKEFFTSPNPDNNIKEINKQEFTSNGKQFLRYLFYSKKYYSIMKSNPNWHMLTVNNYDNILKINEKGETYYPYSMIITIPVESEHNFEYFLKIKLGEIQNNIIENNSWRYYFYEAQNYLIQNIVFGLDEMLKYPANVIVHELGSTNKLNDNIDMLKLIFMRLADNWKWNFSTVGDDDKQEFILGILEKLNKDDAKEIYDMLFANNAYYFKKYSSLFNSEGNLNFVLLLTEIYFNKLKDSGQLKSKIDNSNFIIPVRTIKIGGSSSLNLYGPEPIIEILENSIRVHRVDFYVGSGKLVRTYTNLLPDPFISLYGNYGFEDMVKVFVWRGNDKYGIEQGRILALPAFAIKAFHIGISDDVTIKDFITKVIEIYGIILPYMKLLEILDVGYALIEFDYLMAKSVETANAFVGYYISLNEDLFTKNQMGINFLRAYNYLSYAYGAKDLEGLIKSLRQGNAKALIDAENLMTMWQIFVNSPDFEPKSFEKSQVKDEMTRIDNILK